MPFSSFLRKQESSHFNSFWTPAFAGVTELGLFTTTSNIEGTEILKEAENIYFNILEDLKDVVYVIDGKGKFIYLNRAGIDLFGYPEEEIMEMNLSELYVHPEERNHFQKELMRNGAVKDFKAKFRKKNATEVGCIVNSSRIRNMNKNNGEYKGVS